MSRRTERVGAEMRRELMTLIQRELSDPRLAGMPSVTRVEVAEDLSVADVFVTVMGSVGKQSAALEALRGSAGHLRTKLTKTMPIRQVPFLKFHLDERLRKELEVLDLLEKVRLENEEIDRKRAAAADVLMPNDRPNPDPDPKPDPGPGSEPNPLADHAAPDSPQPPPL